MPSIHDGRFNDLRIAYTQLMNAATGSPFIQVDAEDAADGWPAEKYLIAFTCKGIARIFPDGTPEYSEHHSMKLELPPGFPCSQPSLRWLTDIWHPNIDHKTGHVCTNELANWFPQRSLADFVVGIAEMVQYKNYFARNENPYPVDAEVAKWVRDVAETKGWIGPEKPVDPRPIQKGGGIMSAGFTERKRPGIRLGIPLPRKIRFAKPSQPSGLQGDGTEER